MSGVEGEGELEGKDEITAGGAENGSDGSSESVDPSFDDMLADFGLAPAEGDKDGKPDGKGDKEDVSGKEDSAGAAGGEAGGKAATDEKGDDKDAIIAQLQATIAELSNKSAPAGSATDEGKAADKDDGKAAENLIEEYFKDEAEYTKALDDPAEMNKVLTRVRSDAAAVAREDIMRTIPSVITPLVQTTIAVNMASAQFYKDNPDLVVNRQFVGFVTNDLIGKNPDWTMEKLFDELGKEVRTRLGLKKTAEKVDKKTTTSRPAFVSKGGGGRGASGGEGEGSLNPLEKEIEDMIM